MENSKEQFGKLSSIEDAAKRTGLKPEEIERAEQLGLLSTGREVEGYYTATQLRALDGLARLRELGLSMEEIHDLRLSEDILAEIEEYLGLPRKGRPSLDISIAFLKATIQVLKHHKRIIENQINQLENLKHSLTRRAETFEKLLNILQDHARQAA
jgi:DNA-binding transcriptional MerR regulator